MGFSVTATHAIFFIAMLAAGSVGMDAYFDASRESNDARAVWVRDSASQLDTNLTLLVFQCNSNCDPPTVPLVEIDVYNTGTTVIDARNLTLIIDGRAHTYSNFTDTDIIFPVTVSTTDLILPGETMRIDLANVPVSADYDADDDNTHDDDLPVQIMTLDGVIGRR